MLHHVSVGVADVARAAQFYDKVLGALGYRRVMEFPPYGVAYGQTVPEFWIQLPNDERPAAKGNGTHVAFVARTKAAVHAFHEAALEAGGTDDGGPGPRPDYGPHYYGAFACDPDGNRIEAVLQAAPPARPKSKTRAKPKAKPSREAAVSRKKAGRRGPPRRRRVRKR